jgi:hypothetical protein
MKYYIGALIYEEYPKARNLTTIEIITARNRGQAESKLRELSERLSKKGKRVVSKQLAYLGNIIGESKVRKELTFKTNRHPIII